MESPAYYGSEPVRPRLTVVKDDGAGYSALPHAVLTDTRLSMAARVLYGVMQMHWWQGGECWASHATLAAEMGVKERQIRRLAQELVAAGYISERLRGHGQAKAYSPMQADKNDRLNGSEMTASEPKRSKMSEQQDKNDRFKRSKMSDRRRSTEEDTSGRKNPLDGGAADAAQPATEQPKAATKPRGTRCPESFELTERHLTYAATLGFSPDQARAETDKFLAHHRFKGTVGVDWYAGWQNWLRKAVTFGAQQPSRRDAPPARSSQPTPRPASSKPMNVRTY